MAKRRLTQQQKRRISHIRDQRLAQAEKQADQQLAGLEPGQEHSSGRIITRHGRNLIVEDEQGQLHPCLFRQNIGHAVCGDRVVWQPTGDKQGVVTAIEARSSTLIRPDYSGHEKPLAANIDTLIIVLAPEPPPLRYLLDQYLVSAINLGIDVALCLNKSDLMDAAAMRAFDDGFDDYRTIGYPLVKVSARQTHGLAPLQALIEEKTTILLGQSGVGKSSLISALLPDLEIQTGKLSETSGQGCHTTTATTLYHLPQGGSLIDSPGVRSFRPMVKDRNELENGFREFKPFLGQCHFSNCSHQHEPNCAIISAVENGDIDPRRLETFRHMAAQLS